MNDPFPYDWPNIHSKFEWASTDASGTKFGHSNEPRECSFVNTAEWLSDSMIKLSIGPPCPNWRESKRRRPQTETDKWAAGLRPAENPQPRKEGDAECQSTETPVTSSNPAPTSKPESAGDKREWWALVYQNGTADLMGTKEAAEKLQSWMMEGNIVPVREVEERARLAGIESQQLEIKRLTRLYELEFKSRHELAIEIDRLKGELETKRVELGIIRSERGWSADPRDDMTHPSQFLRPSLEQEVLKSRATIARLTAELARAKEQLAIVRTSSQLEEKNKQIQYLVRERDELAKAREHFRLCLIKIRDSGGPIVPCRTLALQALLDVDTNSARRTE